MKSWLNRREVLKLAAGGVAVAPISSVGRASANVLKSRIKQSVCRWCYKDLSLEQLANGAKKIGLQSVELLSPEEYLVVKEYGLTCAMLQGTGPIHDCFNRVENHERCVRELKEAIDFAAQEGLPNVICFSGNRDGMDDQEGLENCLAGLKKIVGYAEERNVTICLELLNSKVNHKDYMADRTEWGVRLAKEVASPRFKLLYDIYHMQIMEGDIIRTIEDNHEYIGHYHTGGVPGRNEIDESQELNYSAIVKAILDTGYDGFLGQEFIPIRDPLSSLAEAYEICAV